ncbi:MAG TPA: ABC transporter permease subunit [Chloroflexota bacterium]|jgi:ABC-type transport system involved in multi-copper enzyme maturation permease subunit
MPILIIARLTLREASRRRLLIAVALLTVVVIGFTGWGFQRILAMECNGRPCEPVMLRIIAAMLLIMVTFMFSFIFTIGAVFVASPSIAGELESGVALAILPRPIRRSDVVLGKWLGLAILICGYTVLTMTLEFVVVSLLVDYAPPDPVAATIFLMAQSLVLLTLTLLCSTRLAPMTGGIVALLLFGIAWMGGVAKAVGAAVGSEVVQNVGTATSLIVPTDGLWRGALYHLEPAVMVAAGSGNRIAAANPFLTLQPPSLAYDLYALAWVAAVLGLAIFSFSRRQV